MKSDQHGSVSVGRIDDDGLDLLVNDRTFRLDFQRHPWFKGAPEAMLRNVSLRWGEFLRWPDLDVDLEVESLVHPERYPLRFVPNPTIARWISPTLKN